MPELPTLWQYYSAKYPECAVKRIMSIVVECGKVDDSEVCKKLASQQKSTRIFVSHDALSSLGMNQRSVFQSKIRDLSNLCRQVPISWSCKNPVPSKRPDVDHVAHVGVVQAMKSRFMCNQTLSLRI